MTTAATLHHDPTRRNVLALAAAQALGQTMLSVTMVITALVGRELAADKSFATLPLALQFTTMMLTTVPASMLMHRFGRRAGFTVGVVVGFAGAMTAAAAVYLASFSLFIVGSMMMGVQAACMGYYRFAAADTASDSFRPRAISLVLAGGVVAAVAGPELAKWGRDLIPSHLFAGCYLVIGVLLAVTGLILQLIDIPRLSASQRIVTGRPVGQIARQPRFVVAVLSAAIGYGIMTLVMTATPLALSDHGFDFSDTAFVIQWHALAMFAPSFVTGRLIQRFGVVNIVLVGALLNAACLFINLAGTSYLNFWTGLFLLGLGWNFMFIGGTTLLTETCAAEERAKTQALNDFLVFTTVALASFSSGALHSALGWSAVNLAMVPPLGIALAATLWLRLRLDRRPAIA